MKANSDRNSSQIEINRGSFGDFPGKGRTEFQNGEHGESESLEIRDSTRGLKYSIGCAGLPRIDNPSPYQCREHSRFNQDYPRAADSLGDGIRGCRDLKSRLNVDV
jgi:hypothetical protein